MKIKKRVKVWYSGLLEINYCFPSGELSQVSWMMRFSVVLNYKVFNGKVCCVMKMKRIRETERQTGPQIERDRQTGRLKPESYTISQTTDHTTL